MYKQAAPRGGRPRRAIGCTLIDLGDPQPASNASPLHGSRPGVAEGCGQCCGTRQRCKSTAARAGGEPAISSGSETLSAAATRWQERAKMTDASENTPHWTAGGLPRTVPSSLSPGGSPPRGKTPQTPAVPPGRPLGAPGTEGSVRPRVGRGSRRARARAGPRYPGTAASAAPQYNSFAAPTDAAPDPSARAISSRIVLEAGSPRRTRSHAAEAASASDPTNAPTQRPWPSPRRPRMY